MKLIISKATVTKLNAGSRLLVRTLSEATGEGCGDTGMSDEVPLDDTHVNHSLKLIDGEYVLEVNDEGMLKFMALYLKVAVFIKPFIKPLMELAKVLKTDLDEIEDFFNARKPGNEPGTGRAAKERYLAAQEANSKGN